MAGEILGHINCPSCGTVGGMRITHDKNGEPFGFCEATCNQQMRIGGNSYRVKRFLALYPWAEKREPIPEKAPENPVTVTAAETAPAARPTLPRRGVFDLGL